MQEQQGRQNQHFEFTGSGWEYFRIWIVNVLLTVLTLGIYGAWAKVRRLQYFYRNTRLADASFDFHGMPKAILKGRLIAFALLMAYNFTSQLNPILGLIAGLLLALVMPLLLVRSLRFRLFNTSYRGLRFGFAGQARGAYDAFLKYPLLAGLSAYLLAPLAHQRFKRYQFDNSRFGSTPFRFGAAVKSFYILYLSGLAIMAGTLLLVAALAAMSGTGEGLRGLAQGAVVAGPVIVFITVASFLVVSSLLSAYMQNLVWDHTALAGHSFFSTLSARRLLWVRVTNFIGVLLTFGLYMPFAAVRTARLRLQSMGLTVSGDLSEFVAGQQLQAAAAGDEMAEAFDVDVSF